VPLCFNIRAPWEEIYPVVRGQMHHAMYQKVAVRKDHRIILIKVDIVEAMARHGGPTPCGPTLKEVRVMILEEREVASPNEPDC